MSIVIVDKNSLRDEEVFDILKGFYGGRNQKISNYLSNKGCCGEKVKVRYKYGMIKVKIKDKRYTGLALKVAKL
jgi:hypothetical protein